MWQVLGFAGFVIATLGVAYGFWMISSLYKELPDIPANQLNYAFSQHQQIQRTDCYFFAIVALDVAVFVAAFALQPQ